MDRILEMTAFVSVAEAESFSSGAKTLGLSASTVTRSIAALEARLGARLLLRTTRAVRLTDAGRQFLDDAKRLLREIEDADQSVGNAAGRARGELRITAPILFGEMHLLPVLREFLDLYPDVRARLLLLDRVINIIEEGIDLALRIGRFDDSSLSSIELGSVRRVLVASPDYLARHGAPAHPRELDRHRIAQSTGHSASREWLFRENDQTLSVHIEPTLTVSSLRATIDCAREGWSLARVLSYQVRDELERGALVGVLEDFEPAALPVCLVFPPSRRPSATLMHFVELASQRLQPILA